MVKAQSPAGSVEWVAELFRQTGWKVRGPAEPSADAEPTLAVRRGAHSYAVEVKSAEGRRDRLVPLLAQAILQAQAFARRAGKSVAPLAVVGADRVSEPLLRDLQRFALDYGSGVAVGVVDREGLRWFQGAGLASLNSARPRSEKRLRVHASESPVSNLFSDLNQWLLKVLLAPSIPEGLLNAPRGAYRNASQLAEAASVSVMSAFRFVRQLRAEGFLNESEETLDLVRREALLRRWQASSLAPMRSLSLQWSLRGDPERQVSDMLRRWGSPSAPASGAGGRACLGLFAAADALGLGFVRGVPPYVYLERLEPQALRELGFSLEPSAAAPDVVARIPSARESVFRGVVSREGVPVSDVLQVWLDAGAHPARGQDQADLIYRRILAPVVEGAR